MGKAVTCMLYLMVFFACFGSLTNIGLRTVEQCPSNEIEWETRSEEFHCRENQDRYDCLRIKHTKKFIEGCIVDNGIRGRYTNGTYPVYDEGAGKRDTLFCPPHRYQNVSYHANQPGLDWCPYEKSNCTGDGQVTVENALVHHEDNICICGNGYILNPEYQTKGSCNPGTDDCCLKNNTKDLKKERTDWRLIALPPQLLWWHYVLIVAGVCTVITSIVILCVYIYRRETCCRQRSCAKESVDYRKIERGETDDDNSNKVCDSHEENDSWVTINHKQQSPVEQIQPENIPFQHEYDLDMLDYSPVPKSGTEPQMDYMTT